MLQDPKICLGLARATLGLAAVSILWLFGLLLGLLNFGVSHQNSVAIANSLCLGMAIALDMRAQKLVKAEGC